MEKMRWTLGRSDIKSITHLILGASAGVRTAWSFRSLAVQAILEFWKWFPYLL